MLPSSTQRIATPEKTFKVTYSDPGPLAAETAAIGLHCWGGSKADLDSQAAELAKEGYRIVTFNFPEVETLAVPLRMGERLAIINGLATHLQLGRFGLIGHSFGGEIAIEYATQHPGSVAGILNCMGSMELSDRFFTANVASQTEEEFINGGAEQFVLQPRINVARGLSAYLGRVAGFLNNKAWLAAYHQAAVESVESAKRGSSVSKFARLPGFKMYVHGEYERPHYLRYMHLLEERELIAVEEIPAAGHFPHIDNPGTYTATIRAFMQRINE